MELCTVFDKSYILKGLSLYESIKDNNLILNILCIDNFTYEKLSEIKLKNVILYNLVNLEI